MFQRNKKIIYWVSIFLFLAVIVSGVRTGLVSAATVAPQAGGGSDISVTAAGAPDSSAVFIVVDVQISSLNGKAVGANTFSGDTIVQTGSDFYIEDSTGKQIAQIPSAINLAAYDVIDNVQLGTYCAPGTSAQPTTVLPCGSDYLIPGDTSGNLTITSSGVIYYQGFIDPSLDDPNGTHDVAAGKGAVLEQDPIVGCPSGPNISLSAACSDSTASETNWLIPDNTSSGAVATLAHTKMSLPLTNYTVPTDLATSAVTPNDASASGTPSCDNSGFSLSWIMCPLIDGMAKAVDGIYGDLVEPLLATPPIVINQPAGCLTNPPTVTNGCDPTHTYEIWSEFRTYGNIFLVLALLGLVFGEIIGGGIIQAYTAKKMLPRILLAVILINLSVYLIAALLDITNVIGVGLSQLISAPFTAAGAFHIVINGTTSGIGLGVFVGAGVASIWALALAPELIMMFLLFMLLPALLAMLAVLFTVVIRQGLIIFLVISSPVAFALYVLPNTEQYFKKWWHLLFTTLLVFPIIAVIFAMANALSVTLSNTAAGQNGGLATISQLVAMVAIVMPLFLIPFAFKIAGGVLGSIYGGLSGLGKKAASGIQGDPRNENSFQNKMRRRFRTIGDKRGGKLQGYLRSKTKGDDAINTDTWLGRRAHGLASQGLKRLPNYERRVAQSNKREAEAILGDLNTGADTWGRALFAVQQAEDKKYVDANGETQTLKKGHYYSHAVDSNGRYTEFAAGDVAKAQGYVKGNASRFQALTQYEISKVANDQEFYGVDKDGNTLYDPTRANELDTSRMPGGSFMTNYLKVAKEAKLGSGGAQGATVGAFWNSAAQRRELKATKLNADYSGYTRDNDAFVQDYGENVGLYTSTNSKSSLTYSLLDYYKELDAKQKSGQQLTSVEQRSYRTLQGVASTFRESLSQSPRESTKIETVSDDGTPQSRGGGTGAPVSVNAAMRAFVKFDSDARKAPRGRPGPRPPDPYSPQPSGPPAPRQPSGPSSSPKKDGELDIHHEDGYAGYNSSPPIQEEIRSTSAVEPTPTVSRTHPASVSRVRLSPDIMDLDKNGNPHREDGKFLSNDEAEIAQSNEDVIRSGLAGRVEESRVIAPTVQQPPTGRSTGKDEGSRAAPTDSGSDARPSARISPPPSSNDTAPPETSEQYTFPPGPKSTNDAALSGDEDNENQ